MGKSRRIIIPYFHSRIAIKLTGWFLLIGLAPLVFAGYFYYSHSVKTVKRVVTNNLVSIAERQANHINSYFEERKTDVTVLVRNPVIINFLSQFDAIFHNQGVDSPEYAARDKEFRPFATHFIEMYGYYDFFFIASTGDVVFTVIHEDDFGTNLNTEPASNSELAKVFTSAQTLLETEISDFRYYAPSHTAAAFVAAPVFQDGTLLGVVALQMNTKEIYRLVQNYTGLGETGETVIASKIENAAVVLNPLRHDPEAAFKRQTVMGSNKSISMQYAVEGKKGSGVFKDYRGVRVLGVWMYLPHLRLGMEVKIDEAEAFASTRQMRTMAAGLFFVTGVIVLSIAFFVSGFIVKPTKYLNSIANRIAVGDLSGDMQYEDQEDELGQLARSFRKMILELGEQADLAQQISENNLTAWITPRSEKDVLGNALARMQKSLRTQIQDLRDGIEILSSSASEIMASASQLASSSTEVSVSITETTATVEETKQVVNLSNGKLKKMSEVARKAAQISSNGEKATNSTMAGINRIREQVDLIAASIMDVREQSQVIGAITSAVDDLANQSKLLAVNASIEAAKAGEHGKGFAVVAQEIKRLAIQSKQATFQVRTILYDVQKAIGMAVKAAEQGSITVEEGVRLSAQAGEALQELGETVLGTDEVAGQIAAASQQQLIGMDQIASAMESIKKATNQNVSGTKQMEISATNLHELGQKLSDLVKRYKV